MSSATLFATALLFATSAAAQGPKLSDIQKNIERCNRTDFKSADEQISGCTALIQSDGNTPRSLGIAYNNRGNAFVTKGEI